MTTLQRRAVLRGASLSFAGLAGALGAGAITAEPAAAADRTLSPRGTWAATITIPGQWTDVSLYAFTSDGILLNSSNAGTIGIGAWKQISRDCFTYSFREYLLSTTGQIEGELRVTLQGKFISADKFEAKGVAKGFDTAGNQTVEFQPIVTANRYALD